MNDAPNNNKNYISKKKNDKIQFDVHIIIETELSDNCIIIFDGVVTNFRMTIARMFVLAYFCDSIYILFVDFLSYDLCYIVAPNHNCSKR